MNIFLPLYLRITKKRFIKRFHPFRITKKPSHLISVPSDHRDFLRALNFLGGLRNSGKVLILMPRTLISIYRLLKHNIFQSIFYDKSPLLFSKEYKILKGQLGQRRFNFLIELNVPANISLPYLVSAERRICFGEKNNFPYYNILIKDGINTLSTFFKIKESNTQDLFRFNTRSLKKIEKKFNKNRPLLFVNNKENINWDGDKMIVGEDVSPSDAEAYETLYLSDAYCGDHDAFYEFAKIFNKKIIEQ